jgi:hypothetical protein
LHFEYFYKWLNFNKLSLINNELDIKWAHNKNSF